jgi:hypothetical protein
MSQSEPRRCHTASSNWLRIMRNQEPVWFWLWITPAPRGASPASVGIPERAPVIVGTVARSPTIGIISATIGTPPAIIMARRAVRRNPSASPPAPMTGHWVPAPPQPPQTWRLPGAGTTCFMLDPNGAVCPSLECLERASQLRPTQKRASCLLPHIWALMTNQYRSRATAALRLGDPC